MSEGREISKEGQLYLLTSRFSCTYCKITELVFVRTFTLFMLWKFLKLIHFATDFFVQRAMNYCCLNVSYRYFRIWNHGSGTVKKQYRRKARTWRTFDKTRQQGEWSEARLPPCHQHLVCLWGDNLATWLTSVHIFWTHINFHNLLSTQHNLKFVFVALSCERKRVKEIKSVSTCAKGKK